MLHNLAMRAIPLTLRIIPLLAAVLIAAGCEDGPLFEKTNPELHPPGIVDFQYSPTSLFSGDSIRGTVTYYDEGADVISMFMRDLKGSGPLTPTPPVVEPTEPAEGEEAEVDTGPTGLFFDGVTGTVEWEVQVSTGQAGLHTAKVWLEDSWGSRSEPVYFDFTVGY